MSYNIRFVEEEEKRETIRPARVKTLFDEYTQESKRVSKLVGRKISVAYTPETIDWHEKIFDDFSRKKPESLRITINANEPAADATNIVLPWQAVFI